MVLILKCDVTMIFHNLILILYITNVQAVPEDYCFGILNRSDCGLPPTPVFSYSKPGSRCELDIWRGCPSENLFKDEYQCSDLCIGKLFRPSGTPEPPKEQPSSHEDPAESEEVIVHVNDVCYGEIDTSCTTSTNETNSSETNSSETYTNETSTSETYTAFTFDNDTRSCNEVEICAGSNSTNIFLALAQCEETCLNSHGKWASAIKDLEDDELEKLNDVVDGADQVQKLKHNVMNRPPPDVSSSSLEEKTEAPLHHGTIVEAEVI